jgi:hypothetical protein
MGFRLPFLTLIFPSWRFFGASKATPELQYRLLAPNINPDQNISWIPLTCRPRRRWWNLFFNPQGNLALAQYDFLDRMLAESHVMEAGGDSPVTALLLRNQIQLHLGEHDESVTPPHPIEIQIRYEDEAVLFARLPRAPHPHLPDVL